MSPTSSKLSKLIGTAPAGSRMERLGGKRVFPTEHITPIAYVPRTLGLYVSDSKTVSGQYIQHLLMRGRCQNLNDYSHHPVTSAYPRNTGRSTTDTSTTRKQRNGICLSASLPQHLNSIEGGPAPQNRSLRWGFRTRSSLGDIQENRLVGIVR